MLINNVKQSSNDSGTFTLNSVQEAEKLIADFRKLLVKSESALINNNAIEYVAQLERWIESYRRGLSAAEKIYGNGLEMLKKTRDQLNLALEEQHRLEDEGGNVALTKEQINKNEEIATALRRIDQLIPIIDQSFQCNLETQ